MKIKLKNLNNSDYRRSYLKYSLREAVSDQVRILREKNNMTQSELAEKSGTTQSVVSRLENPDSAHVNISSLLKIANAFDVALAIEFCGFKKYVQRLERIRFDVNRVENFSDEMEAEKQNNSDIRESEIFENNVKNSIEQDMDKAPLGLTRNEQKASQAYYPAGKTRQFIHNLGREDLISFQGRQDYSQGNV